MAALFLKMSLFFSFSFFFPPRFCFGCVFGQDETLCKIAGNILCFHSEPWETPASVITAQHYSGSFIIFYHTPLLHSLLLVWISVSLLENVTVQLRVHADFAALVRGGCELFWKWSLKFVLSVIWGICEGGFSLSLTRPVVCSSWLQSVEESHLVELGHH